MERLQPPVVSVTTLLAASGNDLSGHMVYADLEYTRYLL